MHSKHIIVCFLLTLFSGCFDRSSGGSTAIHRVVPNPVVEAELATLKGIRLPKDSMIVIDGQSALIERRSPRDIAFRVPSRVAPGHRLLLLRSPSLKRAIRHPIEVMGPHSRVGTQPPAAIDFGTGTTQAQSTDANVPEPLQALFAADPVTEGAVAISALDQMAGQLQLRISLPESARPVWGAAFHLLYDPNIMVFRSVSNKPSSHTFQAQEPLSGRLAIGWVVEAEDQGQLVLNFDLVGSGEARLEFPVHHRTLRDVDNTPLPQVSWLTGSVRVREVSP